MTALEWQEFEHLPTRNYQVQFTGFAAGNGYALLSWLDSRGILAVREGNDIRIITEVRDDARIEPGYWIVDDEGLPPELGPEVWPITSAAHGRYRAVSS
jgi:hypothetical protein